MNERQVEDDIVEYVDKIRKLDPVSLEALAYRLEKDRNTKEEMFRIFIPMSWQEVAINKLLKEEDEKD